MRITFNHRLIKIIVDKTLYVLALIIILFGVSSRVMISVYADSGLSSSELQALNEYPNWVPSFGQCSADSTIQTIPPGTLPTFIPEPYNGAFTAGAKAHNVSPSLIAALFSEEHNLGGSEINPDTSKLSVAWANLLKTHTDPNSGWQSSGAGAQGPFQFITATFIGLKYDVANINNLLISADAAAAYAQHDSATIDQPKSTWNAFIYSYNHADWYVKAVLQYYDYYASQPPASDKGNPIILIISSCDQTSSVDCSNADSSTSGLSQVRQTVVCLAKSESALWKSQPNFDSPYPKFTYAQDGFLKYTDGAYEQWCADFVSWLYKQAGYKFDLGGGWRIPGVSSIEAMGRADKNFHWHPAGSGYTPMPGDLEIFGSNHVNIVVGVSSRNISNIGGDLRGVGQPDGAFGSRSPVSGSIVGTDNNEGGTGYVSPD